MSVPAITIDTQRPGVPFARLVRVELRKMTDTRAGRTLVIVTAALMVITVAIMLLVAALNDDFDATASDFAGVLQFVSLLIVPVFAIMITTSEWNQRTHLTTFTLEPQRQRIIWAKISAVLVFSVATLALAVAAGAIGNAATALFDYEPVWNFGLSDLLWSLALQLALILSAFALGLALLNTAAAVAVFYVSAIMLRFIVYPILFGVIDAFVDIAPYLDVFFGFVVAQEGEDLDTGDALSGAARFAPMVVSTLLWVVVPGVIGWLRANRTELK
jgi:ABC-type transport system involved in multi-copper enzyme maturation permease subunit